MGIPETGAGIRGWWRTEAAAELRRGERVGINDLFCLPCPNWGLPVSKGSLRVEWLSLVWGSGEREDSVMAI